MSIITSEPVPQEITRKAQSCSVARYDTDVGNAGDMYKYCTVCGTHAGNICRLSEEMIAQKIGADINRQRVMEEGYYDAQEEARTLVRRLVHEERVAANLPIRTDVMLTIISASVFVGILIGLAFRIYT